MNGFLHTLRPIRFFVLVFMLPLFLQAQNNLSVTGTVKSDTGEALPGVYVLVKGTSLGSTTDADGKYNINVADNATLIFTFIGMKNTEVAVNNQTVIDVIMTTDIQQLNEVVVVGYGTQKKTDLTGSVASVSSKDLQFVPIMRADQMLQGRVSGVQITQTNAAPGGNVSIRIRGTNSINSGNEPLFVIDGFPGAGDLNSINPNDIESIDVLKDASATAIYGSRGANGVIIITTKKGKAGTSGITFEAYTGVQTLRKKYDLMNASEFAKYLNDVQTLTNTEKGTTVALPYTQEQLDTLGKGTDWQDELFRTAPVRNYQLGFNAGNENTRFNLSMNYFDQDGIVINSGFKRASMRINLDQKFSEKFNVSFTSQITRSAEKRALVNTAGGNAGGVVMDVLRINPATPVYDANGNYTQRNGPLPYAEGQVGNPIAYANRVSDDRNVFRTLINLAAEYSIIKNLKLRVSGGTDLSYGNNSSYVPSGLFFGNTITNGSASQTSTNRYSWLNENILTYDKSINKHGINVVAGFSAQEFINENFTASSLNFFTDALETNNLSFGSNVQPPSSGKNGNKLASYFGRINYKFSDKYFVTFTMRADGSSKFGPNKKWGYFPSAAIGWRIIEENFMQNIAAVSDLKLRASYGVTGNQEINAYQSMARYQSFGAHNQRTDYVSGTTRLVGLAPANIPNPDLGWESTKSFDVGIDAGFFSNRITLTADYYDKTTNDLLLEVSIPATTGQANIILNAGSVSNKGYEIMLNTVNVDREKFKWNTSFNFSSNRNKVLDLAGEKQRFVGQSSSSVFPSGNGATSILRVGEPIGAFYGYEFDGIWQTAEEITNSGMTTPVYLPGDPRYIDRDGNKIINADDRTIIGYAQPDFIYGITNNISYGGVSLMFLLQGVQGSNVLNLNRYELESGFSGTNKVRSVITESWTGPGTSNTLPKVNSGVRRSTGVTDEVVEDGSFLRLKTITISYNIPVPKALSAIKSASIYVTGQNLYTWTKYSGYDPEVNSFGSSNLSLNTDYNAFPSSKTLIAGVKFGF
jgi:TonB-dependent starch-binding outer membrane protein SusC